MRAAIAYIDGYNLYHGLRYAKHMDCLWLDLRALVAGYLRRSETLAAVKYYTAYPRDDPPRLARHMRFVEALEAYSGVEVVPGQYGLKGLTCHTCGTHWETYTEKMTDSAIATDLVADANDNLYEVALLVSADRDMIPPVRWVRARYPEREIRLLLPPSRRGDALAAECSAASRIRRRHLTGSQLPETVVTSSGAEIHKPDEWKVAHTLARRGHVLPLALRKPIVHILRKTLVALAARDVKD